MTCKDCKKDFPNYTLDDKFHCVDCASKKDGV